MNNTNHIPALKETHCVPQNLNMCSIHHSDHPHPSSLILSSDNDILIHVNGNYYDIWFYSIN